MVCGLDSSMVENFTKNKYYQIYYHIFVYKCNSDAARGWVRWALAQQEFGSPVNSITTRGADYPHPITTSPPGFENLAASL